MSCGKKVGRKRHSYALSNLTATGINEMCNFKLLIPTEYSEFILETAIL